MLKRCAILSLLFFAYTIVFAHSIIPHHHHEDHHKITATLVDHPHAVHHDSDADDEGFGNYTHSTAAGDLYKQGDPGVNNSTIATPCLISVFNFVFDPVETLPFIRLVPDHTLLPSQHCLSPKGLRAPPVC
jgi:hypothetical protein